jgi:uncharacterized protein YacL
MKTNGWEARLLLILLLSVAGAFANQWWIALVGLGIGLLAVAVEALFFRIPMDDVLLLVMGATVGLLLGLLAMLVLKIGRVTIGTGEGADPLLMIPLALGYAFAHVALVRGRKLGFLRKEAVPSAEARPVLVDLSAIIDGRVADMVLLGLLSGPFVIPTGVRLGLDAMAKSRDMVQRGRARRGTETLERLVEAAGKTGGLEDRDFGGGDREKHRMLEWMRRTGAILISSESDFLDTSAREGVRVIRLDELGAATRAVILPGERIRLKPLRRGRNAGQAVGYTGDGTMVVIEEGEELIGKPVEVTAHTTFRASGGTMVFARLAQVEEEQPDAPQSADASGTDEEDE